MPRGPHGDLGAPFAGAGDFGKAKPPAARLCAAADRQHAGNQVLAGALCFLQERPDDPAADAGALMAGAGLDAGLPGGDDLPPVRVEGAVMKRALNLLVPSLGRRDVVAHGRLVQPVAELCVSGGGRPQRNCGLGKAGRERPARRLT